MARDELDEVLLSLKQDILRAMDGEVDKAVKELYKEETERIYTESVVRGRPVRRNTGSRYRLGLEGSFADENNFEEEIKLKGNGVEYILHNDRISDCTCEYCQNNDTHLDVFIEEGIYGGHGYVKRPAYERSMERIESENVVEKAMENQLKKAGWEFE